MFWSSLADDDRAVILRCGSLRTYAAGAHLFFEGEASAFVVIVLEGHVKITKTSSEGREALIEIRGPNEVIGELTAVDDSSRAATVTAMDGVRAVVVPAREFRELLQDRVGITYAVLASVVAKLRQAADRRLEFVAGDALARLCRRLVELAENEPSTDDGVVQIDSTLTQQELAEWVGVSRDAIVLALRRVRDLGWAETGRKQIRILDIESLKAAAAD